MQRIPVLSRRLVRLLLILFVALATVPVVATPPSSSPTSSSPSLSTRPPIPPSAARGIDPSSQFELRMTTPDHVELSLGAGWNLVSLPLEPDDTAIATVLAPILGSVVEVWAYDACEASPWSVYDPNDAAGSDLATLDHRRGYWIHLSADATLGIDGQPPTDTAVSICTGWNLLGHPRNAPLTVSGALASIDGGWSRVFGFVSDPATPWRFFGVGEPAWVNDLATIEPGHGYWVLATAEGTFTSVDPEPPPTISDLDLQEGQVVTAPLPISATIDTPSDWTLSIRPEGEVEWIPVESGTGTIVNSEIDPTLLLNGIWEVRLEATDIFGQTTSALGNIQVDGAMKPGVVTLSFPDMTVEMAGMPITVVRTYDSRDKGVGDFGAGWRLELVKGSYRNNRPPGDGWIITGSTTGVPQTPCDRSVETLGHFTDVRLSDQISYRFGAAVMSYGFDSVVSGGCGGDVHFVQIGGRPGATLDILGNTEVFYGGQTTHLVDAATGELFDPQTVLLTTPEGYEYVIDRFGGVMQVSEPAGQTVTFNENGVHHSDGRSIFFERDAQGRIRYLIDPAGNTVSYSYDELGDLVAVTDVLDSTVRFEYDADILHHLTRIIRPDGQVAQEFIYDADGRQAFSCGADGSCIETAHDIAGRSETVYDAGGRPTTLVYDDAGNITSRTNAASQTTDYVYDNAGRLLSETDALGGVTEYGYDGHGNLISFTRPHDPTADPADYTTLMAYDGQNRITTIDLPTGGGYRFAYGTSRVEAEITDHQGNVLSAVGFDGSGRAISTSDAFGTESYVLDGYGNLLEHSDVYGRQSTMTYDVLNRLTSLTDADGRVSTFQYDAEGRETRVDYGAGITADLTYAEGSRAEDWSSFNAPTVGTVEREVDADGRLTRMGMTNGGEVLFGYDQAGRLSQKTDPMGRTTSYLWADDGTLSSVTDARGATVSFTRDALGRATTTTDPFGHTIERSFGLDGGLATWTNGRGHGWSFASTPTERVATDPLGRETRVLSSPLGLPTSTIFADGSQQSAEYLLTSPLVGADEYPTRITDEAGREREMAYDNFGRMVSATDLAGAATTYGWAEDFLVSVTGPTGATRSLAYDARGNVTAVTLEDGGVRQLGYGDDNRLAWEIRPSGATETYEYDDGGRLVSSHATGNAPVQRTWNADDRITEMVDGTGTTTYTYDVAGDLAAIDFPDGSAVVYLRDLLGRVIEVTVSATGVTPLTTLYGYDEAGNLVTVTDPLGGVTTWVYDQVNRPTTRTLPNGVTTAWTYDLRDRITSIVHTDNVGLVLASATYQRAISGEPTRITREDGSWVDLSYDGALRLAAESHHDSAGVLVETITYTYDAAGNRTTRTDNSGVSTYGYDPGHRLVSASGASAEAYNYDADGRLISIVRDGTALDLDYDNTDRLVAVSENGSPLVAYQHDGAGRRVAASGLGGTRGFLTAPQRGDGYDSPHLVTDGAGGLAAAWVWLGAEPLMRFGATGPIYYLSDAMGSVIGLADAVGGNAATFHYDGFGNLRQSSGPSADAPAALGGDVRFHGLWQESATGLYHVRAREYDPRTGRFASRDPIEPDLQRPETLHPYSFAASNPHLYADPTGLFTLVEINISINIRGSMGAFQTGLINFLRHEGYEIAGEIATRMLERFINNMIPWHGAIGRVDKRFHKSTSTGEHGDFFEALSGGVMCGVLEASGVGDWIRLEVEIAGDGEPQNDGLGCGYDRDGISFPSGGPPRPDFVISSKSMEDVRKRRGKAFLVGDFKIAGKNIKQNSPQFGSILSFASRYEYVPIALFVTWRDTSVLRRENLRRKALEKHVILWLLSIKGSLH